MVKGKKMAEKKREEGMGEEENKKGLLSTRNKKQKHVGDIILPILATDSVINHCYGM
jgi:hypothetical protein